MSSPLMLVCFCVYLCLLLLSFLFFFNDTATTEIYTLSLHDALPISASTSCCAARCRVRSILRRVACSTRGVRSPRTDRKSTRLNSSHLVISYAVFCLKKKNNKTDYCATPIIHTSVLRLHVCGVRTPI